MPASCSLCGSPASPAADLAPLPVARCGACGFTFRPDLDDAATHRIYEGGAYESRAESGGFADPGTIGERRHNARIRLRFVTEHATAGRLLDVGAAGGAFVLEARQAGFDASGIEPAPAFARHAREVLAVDVQTARLGEVELPEGSFDVITLWHVLEHLPDPVRALASLRAALAPGGLLIVEVPNLASAMAAMLGTGWTHLDPDVHVSHFTPVTLRAALERAGLAVRWTGSVDHSVYLPLARRLRPRPLAGRAKLAVRAGLLRPHHPDRHEFLRAVASRPLDA